MKIIINYVFRYSDNEIAKFRDDSLTKRPRRRPPKRTSRRAKSQIVTPTEAELSRRTLNYLIKTCIGTLFYYIFLNEPEYFDV